MYEPSLNQLLNQNSFITRIEFIIEIRRKSSVRRRLQAIMVALRISELTNDTGNQRSSIIWMDINSNIPQLTKPYGVLVSVSSVKPRSAIMHRAASSLFAGNNSGTWSSADRRNRAQQTSNENSNRTYSFVNWLRFNEN